MLSPFISFHYVPRGTLVNGAFYFFQLFYGLEGEKNDERRIGIGLGYLNRAG